MKHEGLKLGNIVAVEWEDAYSQIGDDLPPMDRPAAVNYTVGVVSGYNQDRLCLVTGWTEFAGKVSLPNSDCTMIPAGLIRNVTLLEDGPDDEEG